MSYANLNYHIMFSTKERAAWLTGEMKPRLIRYLGGIIREAGGMMLEANGPVDHIHVAATLKPTEALSNVIRALKSKSSGWIHETFSGLTAFRWQKGYAAFSVSKSVLPQVIKYIRGQEEHHRVRTFREELIEFFEKHGIEYDERYLLE